VTIDSVTPYLPYVFVCSMQNQHSSYSISSSRNTDPSCHLWVWLFHDNAPAQKSLVAQQAVCNCEFVQLNHPAYSTDLALSDYFLIGNLKYRLRGTWFIDNESLTIAVEAWFESQNRKFYFQGTNSWEEELKNALMLQENMFEKWQYKWYNMFIFIPKLQKTLWSPLVL